MPIGRWANWRRRPAEGVKIGKMVSPVGSAIYVEIGKFISTKW